MNKTVVGIDISKGWFDVSWEEEGNERCQRFSQDPAGYAALLAGAPVNLGRRPLTTAKLSALPRAPIRGNRSGTD